MLTPQTCPPSESLPGELVEHQVIIVVLHTNRPMPIAALNAPLPSVSSVTQPASKRCLGYPAECDLHRTSLARADVTPPCMRHGNVQLRTPGRRRGVPDAAASNGPPSPSHDAIWPASGFDLGCESAGTSGQKSGKRRTSTGTSDAKIAQKMDDWGSGSVRVP
jgi:hypothetical protein